MIKFKVTGVSELVNELRKVGKELPDDELFAAVKTSSEIVVKELKQNYETHRVTGDLIKSVMAFQRKKKGNNDPYYTYYIGPNYRQGGNTAHLLEYGTVERYRANTKQGGVSLGKGRLYGSKISTGRVVPLGIIRRTKDEVESQVASDLNQRIMKVLVSTLEKKGFEVI